MVSQAWYLKQHHGEEGRAPSKALKSFGYHGLVTRYRCLAVVGDLLCAAAVKHGSTIRW